MSFACPKCEVVHMVRCYKDTDPSLAVSIPQPVAAKCTFCFFAGLVAPSDVGKPCHICGGTLVRKERV